MPQPEPLNVLAFAGSLRAASYNRALLRAARELAPESMHIDVADLADIPLYNAELDNDDQRPDAVRELKRRVGDADAVLIATPEYNHSVPGVLQNAIDWVSRPAGRSPLRGRPTGIIGASTSLIGTARAQQQLKLVLLSTQARLFAHPGVLVTQARTKFDGDGRLTDDATREFLGRYLMDFEQFAR